MCLLRDFTSLRIELDVQADAVFFSFKFSIVGRVAAEPSALGATCTCTIVLVLIRLCSVEVIYMIVWHILAHCRTSSYLPTIMQWPVRAVLLLLPGA